VFVGRGQGFEGAYPFRGLGEWEARCEEWRWVLGGLGASRGGRMGVVVSLSVVWEVVVGVVAIEVVGRDSLGLEEGRVVVVRPG
jgi:hypothetical protein